MNTFISVIVGLSIVAEVVLTAYFGVISEGDAFFPITRTWKVTKREFNLIGRIICTVIVTVLSIPYLIVYGMAYSILVIGVGIWEGFKFIFKKR